MSHVPESKKVFVVKNLTKMSNKRVWRCVLKLLVIPGEIRSKNSSSELQSTTRFYQKRSENLALEYLAKKIKNFFSTKYANTAKVSFELGFFIKKSCETLGVL
jgi:hypothetical protein